MSSLDLIKTKLPPYINQNTVLDELIGPIAASIDDYHNTVINAQTALTANGAGSELDALALDMGIRRTYHDPDMVLSIRVQNSIETHRARGSRAGIEREGAEIALVTPFVQIIQFVVGKSAVGLVAIGNVTAIWVQYWVDVPVLQTTMVQRLKEIIPLHLQMGIDHIDVTNASSGYVSVEGTDFLTGGVYTGFDICNYALGESDPQGLVPNVPDAMIQYGNLDLGVDYANYTWLVDWIDYIRWDVDCSVRMEVAFSADQNTWTNYIEYVKNQFVSGSEIKRYAKFQFSLSMNEYESLNHYFFRKMILKGLTTSQLISGETPKTIEVVKEIGI